MLGDIHLLKLDLYSGLLAYKSNTLLEETTALQ